jgi:hypothetical protein
MRRAILVALVFSLVVARAAAQLPTNFMDGNELLESCGTDVQASQYCWGYVTAVADALRGAAIFCVPPRSVRPSQLVDLARLYLRAHPEKRHEPAADLLAIALQEKFPCN